MRLIQGWCDHQETPASIRPLSLLLAGSLILGATSGLSAGTRLSEDDDFSTVPEARAIQGRVIDLVDDGWAIVSKGTEQRRTEPPHTIPQPEWHGP